MNKDNYCETVTAPNCESGRFEDNTDLINKKANTAYSLYVF